MTLLEMKGVEYIGLENRSHIRVGTADVISVCMLAVGQLTESNLGFLFSFPDNDGR